MIARRRKTPDGVTTNTRPAELGDRRRERAVENPDVWEHLLVQAERQGTVRFVGFEPPLELGASYELAAVGAAEGRGGQRSAVSQREFQKTNCASEAQCLGRRRRAGLLTPFPLVAPAVFAKKGGMTNDQMAKEKEAMRRNDAVCTALSWANFMALIKAEEMVESVIQERARARHCKDSSIATVYDRLAKTGVSLANEFCERALALRAVYNEQRHGGY